MDHGIQKAESNSKIAVQLEISETGFTAAIQIFRKRDNIIAEE